MNDIRISLTLVLYWVEQRKTYNVSAHSSLDLKLVKVFVDLYGIFWGKDILIRRWKRETTNVVLHQLNIMRFPDKGNAA